MSKKDLFSVAIKFLSLLLFLNFIENIFQFVLELTVIDTSNPISLYGVSAYGTLIRIVKILFYGLVGYLLFIRSDKIAQKFITENKEGEFSKENILQIVIAYMGLSGIIFSILNLIRLVFRPVVDTTFSYNTLLIGADLFDLLISILVLRYYEKIAHFLLLKIPQRFWWK